MSEVWLFYRALVLSEGHRLQEPAIRTQKTDAREMRRLPNQLAL